MPATKSSTIDRLYCSDKKNLNSFFFQFQKNTEHSNFSNSVVDVFTQLTQCFEVLQKLECQDPEIWKRYMKRFAKTVVKVLTAYSDILKLDFPNHVRDEPTVSCFQCDQNNVIFIFKIKPVWPEAEIFLEPINASEHPHPAHSPQILPHLTLFPHFKKGKKYGKKLIFFRDDLFFFLKN